MHLHTKIQPKTRKLTLELRDWDQAVYFNPTHTSNTENDSANYNLQINYDKTRSPSRACTR